MKKLNTCYVVLASVIVVILFWSLSCSSNVQKISAEALKQKIDSGSRVAVIDVRSKENYDEYHIKDAVLIPKVQIISGIWKPPQNTDWELVLYWEWPNDSESAQAALFLISNGYTNVKVLNGGINAWVNAGYPVVGSPAANEN